MNEAGSNDIPKKEPYVTPSKRPGYRSIKDRLKEDQQKAHEIVRNSPVEEPEVEKIDPDEILRAKMEVLIKWLDKTKVNRGEFHAGDFEIAHYPEEEDQDVDSSLIVSNESIILPGQEDSNGAEITFSVNHGEKKQEPSPFTRGAPETAYLYIAGLVTDSHVQEGIRNLAQEEGDGYIQYNAGTYYALGEDNKVYKSSMIPDSISDPRPRISPERMYHDVVVSEMSVGDYEVCGSVLDSLIQKSKEIDLSSITPNNP